MPRTRPIRVLHVVQNLNYGGMERLIAELLRHADRTRFEPHLLVLQYLGRFGRGLEGMARLHVAGPLPRWSLLRPVGLAREIREIVPDVVHTHSGVWFKASRAARMAGVPFVLHTEHGRRAPDPLSDRLVDGLASRRTDVVVAVSAPLARHLAARVTRGAATVTVIPNGVDTDVFRPRPDGGELRRELNVSPSTPLLGSVGRLEPIKGYEVMVEALARIPADVTGGEPPVLVLAGDGSERHRLRRLAERLGVAARVRFLGWRDDLDCLHAAFTLFTLSSHSEGTSVSLLEAMSAGLCPVVTDVGGNSVILGEQLRHRMVPAADPEALAAAWAEALRHPGARAADAAEARRRVLAGFGVEAMVGRYEALYGGNPVSEAAAR